ncbi:anaphase-promoting complex subunit 1-like, partial [Aphis craccivora]
MAGIDLRDECFSLGHFYVACSRVSSASSLVILAPKGRPALTIASCNIDGINSNKEELLADLCKKNSCDVLCVQETHRSEDMNNPRINGMKLVAIRPHRKYGSAIFVRSSIDVTTSQITEIDDIEILTIEVGKCTVTSIYKPSNSTFAFEKPANFDTKNIHIIIGNFN